jgi:hypothetical protein
MRLEVFEDSVGDEKTGGLELASETLLPGAGGIEGLVGEAVIIAGGFEIARRMEDENAV